MILVTSQFRNDVRREMLDRFFFSDEAERACLLRRADELVDNVTLNLVRCEASLITSMMVGQGYNKEEREALRLALVSTLRS